MRSLLFSVTVVVLIGILLCVTPYAFASNCRTMCQTDANGNVICNTFCN